MNSNVQIADYSDIESAGGIAIMDTLQQCDLCKEEVNSSNEALQRCSESVDIFTQSLNFGRVRGIVAIASCSKSEKRGSDYLQLVQELINRDILVITSGCAAAKMQEAAQIGPNNFRWAGDGLAEFCEFINIQPVFYAGSFADNSDVADFYNKLAQDIDAKIEDLPIAVIMSQDYSKKRKVPGTLFSMEEDPVKTADAVDLYIHNKRLELQWCDRCGTNFSPFS